MKFSPTVYIHDWKKKGVYQLLIWQPYFEKFGACS